MDSGPEGQNISRTCTLGKCSKIKIEPQSGGASWNLPGQVLANITYKEVAAQIRC